MKKPEIKETKGTLIIPKLKSSYWGPFSGLKSQDLIKTSRTFSGVIFCPRSFWWHVYPGSYIIFFSLWHHGGCRRPFLFLWYFCSSWSLGEPRPSKTQNLSTLSWKYSLTKGPGAKNDTTESPGCFNQILTFESRKWSPVATFWFWNI